MRDVAPGVSHAELAVLCALLFVMPLFEVPKHLLWGAYLILWWRARGPGSGRAGSWGAADRVFAAAIGASVVSGLGAGGAAWSDALRAASDPIRMFATGWLIARAPWALWQAKTALCAAVAGAVTALSWGLIELQRAPPWAMLELHSVGHVNHSAIYLAIAAAAAVGVMIAAHAGRRSLHRVSIGIVALLLVSLLIAASRAALAAALVFLAMIAWAAPGAGGAPAGGGASSAAQGRGAPGTAQPGRSGGGSTGGGRLRLMLGVLTLAAVLVYGAVLHFSPTRLHASGESVAEKFASRPQAAGPLAFRDQLWRVAGLAFLQQPVFGIGNDRFRTLSQASLCAPPRDCGDAPLYFAPHAHSLFANTLAERGLVGLAALAALLAFWARALWRGRARARADRDYAAVWSAALGALLVVVLAGLLNTTLHHEHGLLSMVFLGLLIAAHRTGVAVAPAPGQSAW
jgi:hypothetical protein